jgi:hypothetical protein
MKYNFYFVALITTFLFADVGFTQHQISNSVISSGGFTITGANNILSSSIGESFIGNSVNATQQQQAGFWYVYQQTTITDVEDKDLLPTVFKLEQNYPNPFNPSTIIKFGVPERSNVLIKIYDILGSEVVTLVNEEMEAGWYQKNFDAYSYSSGIYLFRMEAGTYISTKKMMLIK